MFQQTVNRNYTAGFPGQVSFAGPHRAKPARITSASGNYIGFVFGVTGEVPSMGVTEGVMEVTAGVGGTTFLGILGHPQHYALFGDASGALDPVDQLPQNSEGEFFDMVTGMTVNLYNETTAVKTVNYGDSLAYVTTATTALQNPQGVPVGGLVSVPAGSSAPAGFGVVPNSIVRNPITIAASAANAPVASPTNIQLTN